MKHRSILHVKDDCWRITFFEKCKLREVYFFCDTDPSNKTLEEILKFPQVVKDVSFKKALVQIGMPQIPSKLRQQKKLFRRITDDLSPEEHY